MKFTPIPVTAAIIGVLAATTCMAQAPSPPASTSSPSSASSPSQRETTRSPAAETPASAQSDASTPHQRQAMGGKMQTMKQCMDAQAAKSSGMSRSEMTKTCNEQMKMQKDHQHLSEAPATAPSDSDSSRTPAPK